MSLDPVLERARGVHGEPRFYPPGQHPAAARYRQHLEALRKLPPSRERNQAIAHDEATLAAFEEGESIAKADYLRRAR